MDLKEILEQKGIPLFRVEKKNNNNGVKTQQFGFKAPVVPKTKAGIRSSEERQREREEMDNFRAEVEPVMLNYVRQTRLYEQMSQEEQMLNKRDYNELQRMIAEMLNYEDPTAKIFAVLAYAKAKIATCPCKKGFVISTLGGLVACGFLVTVINGGVKLYDRRYVLGGDFNVLPEGKEVFRELENLVGRAVSAGQKFFQETMGRLSSMSNLSLDQFKEGLPGKFLLEVPEAHTADGRTFFGGNVLLEVASDGSIRPLEAVGGIKKTIEGIIEGGVFLDNISEIDNEEMLLKERLRSDLFKLRLALWCAVKNGVRFAETKANKLAEQESKRAELLAWTKALQAKETIDHQSFFLGGNAGIVLVMYPEIFRWKISPTLTKEIFCPTALIERQMDGKIKVLEFPDEFQEFWAEHLEPMAPGNDFYGLSKFGVILRRIASGVKPEVGVEDSSWQGEVTSELAKEFGVNPEELGKVEEQIPPTSVKTNKNNKKRK